MAAQLAPWMAAPAVGTVEGVAVAVEVDLAVVVGVDVAVEFIPADAVIGATAGA